MKYVYEFIGTFFLVFTFGMTVLSPSGAGPFAPIAIGTILAVMIFSGAHVSGGHYNPAVTLASYIRGRFLLSDLGIYWIVQLVAAVIAAFFTLYYKGAQEPVLVDVNIPKLFIAEFLFTFALCFAALNVTATKWTAGNSYFGLAVGFVVIAGSYAVGSISSAALNPAVALGMTVMNLSVWANLWIFIFANLLGGAAAALVFKYSHLDE